MSEVIDQAIGEIIVRDMTGPGVAAATANLGRLYDVVRYNWWGIQNLSRAFAVAGGVLAAGLGEAAKATVDFQQGMAQVQRTGNLTVAQTHEMADALRGLALVKPINLDSLTQIATAAGQLGITGVADIKAFTAVIADLVSTTNLTADSAEQLAKLAGPLGITGDQWSRLGSTILKLGINTAATETQIVNTATQLSGLAVSAHATTPEIVAVSAVIASLTNSTQSGATGIQRLIAQMSEAAGGATPAASAQFAEFAKIAGYDTPAGINRFRKSFETDAIPAMSDFLVGLGKIHGGTSAMGDVLRGLGITEQRQIRIMEQMAGAAQQTSNPLLNIKNAVRAANDAWDKNTALTDQAQKLYKTASNQLKILHNVVHDIALGFGGPFLGALLAILKPLADVIWGLDSLPGPVKTILGVLASVTSATLLFGAGMLALIPRITLIVGSIGKLGSVFTGAGAQAQVVIAALREQAATAEEAAAINERSAARMTAAQRAAAVAQMQNNNATEIAQIRQAGAARADAAREARLAQLVIAQRASAQADTLMAESEEVRMQASLQSVALTEEEVAILDARADASARAAEALYADAEAATAAAAAQAEVLVATEEVTAAMVAEAAAAQEEAVASTEASGAAYLLGLAMDAALGPIGIAVAVIGTLVIGLGLLGASHRKASDDAANQAQAIGGLVDVLEKVKSINDQAVYSFLISDQTMLSLAVSAQKYNITLVQLVAAITAVSNARLNDMLEELHQRYIDGDKGAATLAASLIKERNSFALSVQEANLHNQALKNNKGAADGATGANANLNQTLQEQAALNERINSAILDYPQALLGVRQANLQLTQAEQALAAARAAGNTKADDIRKAEDALAEARISYRQAILDVKTAEENLSHARQDEINAVKDAQDKLANDTDSLKDAINAVAEARKKVNQDKSGPTTLELAKAVNALNDAYATLHDRTNDVADAQYNLNYLLQEGASARDIADAREALTEAQNAEADATTNVKDKQKELNDARKGASPKQLAKDERDLAAAQREVASIERQLKQDTRDLHDARKQLADDTLVKQREDELRAAHDKVRSSEDAVRTALINLRTARHESGADNERQAEVNLESALLAVGNAHVQVTKDTHEMHGEMFGTGAQAKALAGQLDKLGYHSGTVGDQITKMILVLRRAKKDLNNAANAATTDTSPSGGGLQIPAPNMANSPQWVKDAQDTGSSWIDSFKHFMSSHIRDIGIGLVSALGGAILLAAGLLTAPIAALVAGLVAGILEIINHRTAFVHAFEKIGGWFKDMLTGTITWIKKHWVAALVGLITGPILGIGTWMAQHFHLVDKFKEVYNWLKDKWGDITGFITGAIGDAASWVRRHFDNLINWLLNLPSRVANDASGMFDWIGNAFLGIVNSVISLWNRMWEALGNQGFHIGRHTIMGVTVFPGWDMTFGFLKRLEIPLVAMAQGGVATKPTLGVFGEAGPEAIIPLHQMFHMFEPIDALALQMASTQQAMASLLSGVPGGSATHEGDTFNINGADADPLEIAREIVFQKKVRLR